jgi:serine/threonine-protein kinase
MWTAKTSPPLLRRIGRIPQDKAIDIARQLCAGLAAAHERGVLHRDLKPANVMIDGDGNVRIADFGLAVAEGDVAASRAGTPQYMAPELLAGGQPSIKTDLYALGLVLFEMFTGRRAYDAKTLKELVRLQQSGAISTPSSVVRDLDPAVERVILRCLEHDPILRPGSALAVAAALPGGNPLAAALAAGETPSPEMVAAAGETSAFSAARGLSLLALIILGLLAAAALSDRTLLIARIPLDKTVDALEDRAATSWRSWDTRSGLLTPHTDCSCFRITSATCSGPISPPRAGSRFRTGHSDAAVLGTGRAHARSTGWDQSGLPVLATRR